MPALFLTEVQVRELLTMELAIEAVEDGFRRLAGAEAMNVARRRTRTPEVMLHLMSAACTSYALVGFKAYTTSRMGARFHVVLYDGGTGEMVALIEADWLGQVRTGAASGVATKLMARSDACRLGIIGTGKQARTQLLAICAVRPISQIRIFSRKPERRAQFFRDMQPLCDTAITSVERSEDALRDMDIVVTATSSREPVFDGAWLSPGTHINAVGSNAMNRAELDAETIRRCDTIVADSPQQCRMEAGDFVAALKEGVFSWIQLRDLSDIVVGRQSGRDNPESITLFQSLGLAIEDLAVAARVLQAARAAGLGTELPF